MYKGAPIYFIEKAKAIKPFNVKIPQYIYNGYILETYVYGKKVVFKKDC